MVEQHLRPRFGRKRLDAITPDDAAGLVREMRAKGYAEQTISRAPGTLSMGFKYAARRLGGPRQNPVAELLTDERPHPGPSTHRIYRDGELEQTIAAARGVWRMLFQTDAVIGARQGEALGIRWKDKNGEVIAIRGQVTRDGEYVEHGKNATALRELPIPADLAALLDTFRAERALEGFNVGEDAYVFSTRTGRPLNDRNVRRELRLAQTRARTHDGRPTFPVLHERDEDGKRVKVPRNAVPCFHGFRHQAASQYIADGWTVEEVADLLGDTVKTVSEVYRHQIDNAKRRRQRAERMAASFGRVLAASAATETAPWATE
jgi:integrase